jgi:hypothetical protein
VAVLALIGSQLDQDDGEERAASPSPAVTDQPTTESTPEPTTTSPEPTSEPPEPAFVAPEPIVLNGSGSKVESIRLEARSPLVLRASHNGSSNFIVELVGPGANELLINDIGQWEGQVAFAEARPGRYRVPIDADGQWTLRFEQPVPKANDKTIPGTVSGSGPEVIPLQSDVDLQPIVIGRHMGQSNFIVDVIGFGTLKGSTLVFNEIGSFRGEELIDDLPAGDYLLAVDADGSWTIRFRR